MEAILPFKGTHKSRTLANVCVCVCEREVLSPNIPASDNSLQKCSKLNAFTPIFCVS